MTKMILKLSFTILATTNLLITNANYISTNPVISKSREDSKQPCGSGFPCLGQVTRRVHPCVTQATRFLSTHESSPSNPTPATSVHEMDRMFREEILRCLLGRTSPQRQAISPPSRCQKGDCKKPAGVILNPGFRPSVGVLSEKSDTTDKNNQILVQNPNNLRTLDDFKLPFLRDLILRISNVNREAQNVNAGIARKNRVRLPDGNRVLENERYKELWDDKYESNELYDDDDDKMTAKDTTAVKTASSHNRAPPYAEMAKSDYRSIRSNLEKRGLTQEPFGSLSNLIRILLEDDRQSIGERKADNIPAASDKRGINDHQSACLNLHCAGAEPGTLTHMRCSNFSCI